jgi:hypothetical protein
MTGWQAQAISTGPITLFDPATDGRCAAIRITNTGSNPMSFNIAGIHAAAEFEGLAAGAEVIKRSGADGIGRVTAKATSGDTTSDGGKHVIL